MLLKINKKGISAAGFGILGGIILLLLSGGVLFAVIKETQSKAGEKLQVDLCRISNEIKFGLKEKTSGFVSSPQACITIDKHTNKKNQVPTKNYKQDDKGAELEIRDMIKNCWNMWLDGKESNMFSKYPLTKGCHVCYTFKIKDKAAGVTFRSLEESMKEPFFAKDTSKKCSKAGGYLKSKCDKGEIEVSPIKSSSDSSSRCCLKLNSECENRGGTCSSTGSPSDKYSLYKWSCPKRAQSCYVKKDSEYSYIRYIREFGKKGGDVLFIPPQVSGETQPADIEYKTNEIYAISFVSPAEQACPEGGAGCYLAFGGYGLVLGVASGLGGYVLFTVGAVGTTATIATSVIGSNLLATGLLYKFGVFDTIARKITSKVLSPVTTEVPNFIVVSTLEFAQDKEKGLGCTVDYGG